MLDPIVNFFTRIFQWIGRGIGLVVGVILWPFLWAGSWYTRRGWILKAVWAWPCWPAGSMPISSTPPSLEQFRRTMSTKYHREAQSSAGEKVAAGAGAERGPRPAETQARPGGRRPDRLHVNQNAWIVDDPLKARPVRDGLGLPPWMDNKASFQRGINQAVRHATELADNGRVRTTSQIDADQDARGIH
jgi:hypothetical protein